MLVTEWLPGDENAETKILFLTKRIKSGLEASPRQISPKLGKEFVPWGNAIVEVMLPSVSRRRFFAASKDVTEKTLSRSGLSSEDEFQTYSLKE